MLLKRLILLYFILLIFEGALRKWVFPGLATPLLIVRDPVVIAIYVVALQQRMFPMNNWVIGAITVAILSSITTMVVGHGSLAVTLYGFRANFLHIPLIFVMGRVLNREDIRRYAHGVLYLVPLMTVLLTLQYLAEPTAPVNVGVGGEGTASFSGADGRMRSSGTFSFITGVVAFYSLAFACWATLAFERRRVPNWLLAVSGVCILLAIPMSISRSLLVSTAIIAFGCGLVFLKLPGWGRTLPRLLIVGSIAVFGVGQLPLFNDAVDAFGTRWDRSTTQKGGVEEAIVGRVWENLSGPFLNLRRAGMLGHGIGAGTQGGAQLLRGERGFLGGEGEWWRLFWEMGVLFGFFFVAYRTWLTVRLAKFGWSKLGAGNPGPWLFFLSAAPLVFSGQWGQPTILGFAIFGAGMVIASGREPSASTRKRRTQLNDRGDVSQRPLTPVTQ